MQVLQNFSLRPYNSFGIDVSAKYFIRFNSPDQLQEAFSVIPAGSPVLVLGGGSNILFTRDFNGYVLKNEIGGLEKCAEEDEFIYIRCGAGENWHQTVLHCIDNNWAGIENLSLIPGCVGASPMQNIGAYGVEIKEVFHELSAYHIPGKKICTFRLPDCEFGYRESIFKRRLKDQFVILTVSFRLRKNPVFHTSYGAIREELERMGVRDLSIKAISQAVIRIRSSKLPDPAEIGNAGSFFKNPSVKKEQYLELKGRYQNLVGYDNDDGTVKLAAGWLIEHCGPSGSATWKGYRKGDSGVHARQALVLVNYGSASGEEIFRLSEEVMQSVFEKFGVRLEREVNII